MSQSKKSKTSHASTEPLNGTQPRSQSRAHAQSDPMNLEEVSTNYPTPLSPPRDTKNLGEDLIYGNGAAWTEEKERILLGPYDYLWGHPGKDIRSQCIAAFNLWLQVPPERLEVITRVVGMLHTASLLVDDVEDNSILRRGIPVANSIFGVAQTINSANYVYFKALQELMHMGNPKLIEIFTEELLNLHRGQGMDLYWRDSLTCPSEADYLEMVGNKTGGLFRLAIKLMQAESAVQVYVFHNSSFQIHMLIPPSATAHPLFPPSASSSKSSTTTSTSHPHPATRPSKDSAKTLQKANSRFPSSTRYAPTRATRS